MGYYINLQAISLEEYKKILKTAHLLPSWKILATGIEENMDRLISLGITNLAELREELKTKARVEKFAVKSGMDLPYLTVLRRVINGYLPKPNKIGDIPGIDESIVKLLENQGMKTSQDLYDRILTPEDRRVLAEQTTLSEETCLELARFADLSRIRWVNHTFAWLLSEAGYTSAEQLSRSDPERLYQDIKALNDERQIFKGAIGKNDMALVVELAGNLDFDAEGI